MLHYQQLHNMLTTSTGGILAAAEAESLLADLLDVEDRLVEETNEKLRKQKEQKTEQNKRRSMCVYYVLQKLPDDWGVGSAQPALEALFQCISTYCEGRSVENDIIAVRCVRDVMKTRLETEKKREKVLGPPNTQS